MERLETMRKGCTKRRFMAETGLEESTAKTKFSQFERGVLKSLKNGHGTGDKPRLLANARSSYANDGEAGIDRQLKFALQGAVAYEGFSQSDIIHQIKIADLRFPTEWFPSARAFKRKLHLHIGPTNSGKTYHALLRLQEAKTGVYAGPLRLLAHEVYARLVAKGKRCNLITGDQMIFAEGLETSMASINCCTVEMVPKGTECEVAVIDEIQMLGNSDRGWAWTEALIGLQAKELHMCGEERALPLVRDLGTAMGEELIIHRYERLSPLQTMDTSLKGSLQNLRKGDCVVSFSRKGIHALKKEIEQTTNKRAAIIYGALPPEVRVQQARLFNDPDNDYDIIVASDAIGMGLNL